MSSKDQSRLYLDQKVNKLLKPMLIDILKSKPENMIDFMINWLDTKGRDVEKFGEIMDSRDSRKKNDYDDNKFEDDESDIVNVEKVLNTEQSKRTENKDDDSINSE